MDLETNDDTICYNSRFQILFFCFNDKTNKFQKKLRKYILLIPPLLVVLMNLKYLMFSKPNFCRILKFHMLYHTYIWNHVKKPYWKIKIIVNSKKKVLAPPGFELMTLGFEDDCSTTELWHPTYFLAKKLLNTPIFSVKKFWPLKWVWKKALGWGIRANLIL